MNKSKLVLVFGATGGSGYHTTKTLLQNGYAVRLVVRSKDKFEKLYKNNID
jgi:short-subunit dehydrogenase